MIELQSQMAFHEDTIGSLNEALAAQQQEILMLRRQLELLKLRQEEQSATADQAAGMPLEEKPPHY